MSRQQLGPPGPPADLGSCMMEVELAVAVLGKRRETESDEGKENLAEPQQGRRGGSSPLVKRIRTEAGPDAGAQAAAPACSPADRLAVAACKVAASAASGAAEWEPAEGETAEQQEAGESQDSLSQPGISAEEAGSPQQAANLQHDPVCQPAASPTLETAGSPVEEPSTSPTPEPAASTAQQPSASPGAAAAASNFDALPDWCDRPLCLRETLEENEQVERYNYLAGLPLVALAAEGKTALVRAVLRHSCTAELLNAHDNNGNTALHLAAAHGRNEIVDVLLEAGARQGRNKKGQRPLDLATAAGHAGVVALLQRADSGGGSGD